MTRRSKGDTRSSGSQHMMLTHVVGVKLTKVGASKMRLEIGVRALRASRALSLDLVDKSHKCEGIVGLLKRRVIDDEGFDYVQSVYTSTMTLESSTSFCAM